MAKHSTLLDFDDHIEAGKCAHAFFTDTPCNEQGIHVFGPHFRLCSEHVVAYLKATSSQHLQARERERKNRHSQKRQ